MKMRQIKFVIATEALLRGKFISSNACIRKEERLEINTLSFNPYRLDKKEKQTNPKLTRKK